MAKAKTEKEDFQPQSQIGVEALAEALTRAIQATKPLEKKTITTRKKNTPWTPKDGSPKLKLRRKMYHHGIPIKDSKVANAEVELLNKIKPGFYCSGWVKVNRRKDRGIDIDYPVKTSSQRLRLVNEFGIRNFEELLRRIIDEAANPTSYKKPDDLDYDE